MLRRLAAVSGAFLALVQPALGCSSNVWQCALAAVDLDGGALEPGDLVEWRFEGWNVGCLPFGPGASIRLPPGHALVAAPPEATWYAATRQVAWTLADAGPGGRADDVVVSRLDFADPAQACGEGFLAGSWSPCPDPRTGSAPSCTPARGAALVATLSWSEGGDGRFFPLEPVRLTALLSNPGNARLEDVAFSVRLPAEVAGWTLAGLPAGAIDRSDLGAGRLALQGLRLWPGQQARVVAEGALAASTAPASRVCAAHGQASAAALREPVAMLPADGIPGPTCFTTEALPGRTVVSAITPCRAASGGGDRIRVEGAGFERDLRLFVDGEPVAPESAGPGEAVFVAPPRPDAGTSDIRIETQRGLTVELDDALTLTALTYNLRLAKVAGAVELRWSRPWAASTIERSVAPDFPCGTQAFAVPPGKRFSDPTLEDGQTWYYRAP